MSGIENPCVGGSIPPQATKVYLAKKPTHAVSFFVSGDKQSSCPVHFRASAFFGKLPSLLSLPMTFPGGPSSPVNVRTDTTGTQTLIKGFRRASLLAVPEEIISTSTPYRAEWSGINRSVNCSSAARTGDRRCLLMGNPIDFQSTVIHDRFFTTRSG